ncbi:hypothetical protein [Photobacterium sp. GB-72]|uniref:hypothetical protein n=1 Tax=Photobacterium sp. GB-72 TaxID=2022105 RepID=UPI000D17ADF1|nr:hypothetical protein [Photobacterium sp. GB-72]PSV29239.1 hypothetical protein C9J40_17770 [Photobacterium sp. GB-72]
MKKLLLAILPFLLFSAPSFAYTKYTVLNSTSGTVDYLIFKQMSGLFCGEHYIDNLTPWSLTPDSDGRGACLLKSIQGILHIDGEDIPLEYHSSGTSYGQFVIVSKRVDNKVTAKIVSADILGNYNNSDDTPQYDGNPQYDDTPQYDDNPQYDDTPKYDDTPSV